MLKSSSPEMISALTLALLLSTGPAEAEADLAEAHRHLRAFRETRALESLRRARMNAASSPKLLARVHLLTGLAHAQLAHEKEALEAFAAAVKLNPEIAPSEQDTSPKVVEWFNRVRQQQGLEPLGAVKKEPEVVVIERPGPVVMVPAPAAPPPPPPSKVPMYVGMGIIGAGALVAGAGLLFGSRAKTFEQQSRAANDVNVAVANHRNATSNAETANALFIASGILGLGGGIVVGMSVEF